MQRSDILEIAQKEPAKTILVRGNEKYTYSDILDRYNEIKKQLLQDNAETTAVILVMNDGIKLFLYYLVCALNHISCIIVASDTQLNDRKLLKKLGSYRYVLEDGILRNENSPDTDNTVSLSDEIVLETSGTSGHRKLVRIDHEIFFQHLLAEAENIQKNNVRWKILCVNPWHQIGIQEMLRAVAFGQPIILPEALDKETLRQILHQNIVGEMVVKSSVLTKLTEDFHILYDEMRSIEVIRYCLEPLQIETLSKIQSALKNVRLYSEYGITECVGAIAITDPKQHVLPEKAYHLPSIGKFMEGVESRIVDANGNLVSSDEIGELVVHTPWQFKGYLSEDKYDGYWITTGDMGWINEDGDVSISGFRKKINESAAGDMYILPAALRNRFVNMPFGFNCLNPNDKRWEMLQSMLMLIHGSMNMNEIRQFYMTVIKKLIPADAYGFEILPLSLKEHSTDKYQDDKWYQDAISDASHHKITLEINIGNLAEKNSSYPDLNGNNQGKKIALQDLEQYCSEPVNILYAPLFSKTSLLHCAVSFARIGENNKFTSQELTMIKQITHHLNLALLNARQFQEIETRQELFQKTMENMDTGIILSNAQNSVYYMNDAMEKLLINEERSNLNVSIILKKFQDNVHELVQSGCNEKSNHFTCYQKGHDFPVSMNIRSVELSESGKFIVSFITSKKETKASGFGDLEKIISPKELQVLKYLGQGMTYKEIAAAMNVSVNTVSFHIKNIYGKMNVNSRTEALNKAKLLSSSGILFRPQA